MWLQCLHLDTISIKQIIDKLQTNFNYSIAFVRKLNEWIPIHLLKEISFSFTARLVIGADCRLLTGIINITSLWQRFQWERNIEWRRRQNQHYLIHYEGVRSGQLMLSSQASLCRNRNMLLKPSCEPFIQKNHTIKRISRFLCERLWTDRWFNFDDLRTTWNPFNV